MVPIFRQESLSMKRSDDIPDETTFIYEFVAFFYSHLRNGQTTPLSHHATESCS